jgi:hypothetical protein
MLAVGATALSRPSRATVYLHGFVIERPMEDTRWSAELLQIEECSGKQGIILVGVRKWRRFWIDKDDAAE